MNAFWELAARHWPLSSPRRRLESALGPERVEVLLASSVLTTGALVDGDTVPCATCRWPAQLVLEGTGMVAICTGPDRCAAERIGTDPERLFLEPASFTRELAAALRLDGTPGSPGPVQCLGTRSFGEEVVAFDFVANPTRPGLFDCLYRHAHQGPSARVVLVPSSKALRADLPVEACGARLCWAGLDQVASIDGGLAVDLRAVLRRLGLRDAQSSHPFAGLLLTPSGASWAGRTLAVEGAPLALRLLRALAESPGSYVSRRELWRVLYPAEHAPSGRVTPGVNPDVNGDQKPRNFGE